MATIRQRITSAIVAGTLLVGACGSGTEGTDPAASGGDEPGDIIAAPAAGVRLIAPTDGAAIQANPPEGLVILDVRTPDEFDAGHLEGAVMVDFYEPDFAERIAELDPDVPYLLYCRSGNRSGQTRAAMANLGFTDVADIDGGILSWMEAGLPIVTG